MKCEHDPQPNYDMKELRKDPEVALDEVLLGYICSKCGNDLDSRYL